MAEIPKSYEPQGVEQQWYDRWVAAGCFQGKVDHARESFAVMIPPPNVTGVLHMGHLLNNTLQDIMVRRARQEGKSALWLPGTDHAGIATQTVVERKLRKEEKKTRHDLGRDEFLKRVWEWKDKHGGIIINQLKKLGCSCDWTRERFTMDDAYARKVQEVFVDLHAKGMIYRGKRMVNWCPVSLTALSDEEVIPKTQKSFFYHYRVEVVEKPGTFLEIATTRPETIMADAAVAVNPKDPRYAALRKQFPKRTWLMFFGFFQLQGLLIGLLSLPIALACANPSPGVGFFEIAGVLLWLVAIGGEAIADMQLALFKAQPAAKGRVCDFGLWKYSRHPNYFFEWLVWIAYFVFALGSPWAWVGLASPLLMLFFLTRMTGIPPAEGRSLASRGDAYRDYQRRTSAFIPWFPKS